MSLKAKGDFYLSESLALKASCQLALLGIMAPKLIYRKQPMSMSWSVLLPRILLDEMSDLIFYCDDKYLAQPINIPHWLLNFWV